jgi:putative addiction module component (TIGR02574 family)
MSPNTQVAEIFQLSVSERIQLVEDLWDSIAADSASVPLSETQKQELDRRLARYRQNPTEGTTWDELKKRLTS